MEFLLAITLLLGDDKDDLAAAAKKAHESSSYSFKGETTTEMPSMMGGMGDNEPTKFEGKYEKGVGAYIRTATHEFVTIGDKTASRPLAEWKMLEDEDDPMALQKRMMSMMSGSKSVKSPHGDFADFAGKIEKAKKSKKETLGETECDLYEIEFTEEAAKALLGDLLPMGGMMGMIPDAESTGTGKVWVDGGGRIVKYEATGKLSASMQGMDFEMSATRTVTFYDVDKTKVEIPEDAKKLFGK